MQSFWRHIALIVFAAFSASAQAPVSASVDSVRNKIGAEFRFTIRAKADTASRVSFPSGKNFGPLEIIRSYKIDTVANGAQYELIKRYGLTQFDSGRYVIPRLQVVIGNKPFLTDSIAVEVQSVKVDTMQQKLYDIRGIISTDKSPSRWWIYLLAVLALGALGYFAYKRFRGKGQSKVEKAKYRSPIEKATVLLQQLEKKELVQRGEVKSYYSELTDIARNYIEEAIHIPAMESTTSQLLAALREASVKKNMALSAETASDLERVLRQADLVKFARSQPAQPEIVEDRGKIEKAILTLDRSIPIEIAEEDEHLAELKRQREIKRRRQQKILIYSAIGLFLIISIGGYFVATRGFSYLKDNLIGHPLKELAEGEWIRSEYGNPPVIIETPRVLKRVPADKELPKEAMAMLKDLQMFSYGSLIDNFYVIVSTNKYREQVDIDLDKAVEGILATMEARGAQNIIVKQEQYETTEGITGLKAYGSMTMKDPTGEARKLYYELLLFKQDNGMQQVMVSHVDGDKYGIEVREKIMNSVELKRPLQ